MSELKRFLKIFKEDVAPFYQKHEETFDLESFHGRFHILRCLILIDALDGIYQKQLQRYSIEQSYYAILFHDIAREGNGFDEWEEESANLCFNYLLKNHKSKEEAYCISRLILKEKPFNLEGQLVYDVDVLDYNRFFFLPEEEDLFDESKLIFGSAQDPFHPNNRESRRKIISLAQQLVRFSEKLSVNTSTDVLIDKVVGYYDNIKEGIN